MLHSRKKLFNCLACYILILTTTSAQRPISEISGLLEVYDNIDNSSLYIGRNAGSNIMHDIFIGMGNPAVNPYYNTFVGDKSGSGVIKGYRNSFFGAYAGTNSSSEDAYYNSFFGAFAGTNNNSGNENSFFGTNAGLSNTHGFYNSFFGSVSGRSNIGGNYNSFFGKSAGLQNTGGSYNSFFGTNAGLSNTIGDYNSLIGTASGNDLEDGNSNVFIGAQSASNMKSGNGNVIMGRNAARGIVSGDHNIFIGHNAGPTLSDLMNYSKRLYVDIEETNEPLIFGNFADDQIIIHGDLDVTGAINGDVEFDGTSIQLKNLGTTDDKGIIWSETINNGFGMIYDGEGSDNRMHLREYFGDTENIMTFKANGHVGIYNEDPKAKLHIIGGSDATLTTGGYVILGDNEGTNVIIDDNEIMARNNGTASDLYLNNDGGNVNLGGKIKIQDDTTPAETGQIRFNASTNDFEGYNGTTWCSLTGKRDYQMFIGPGSFYSNDALPAQLLEWEQSNGVTHSEGFNTSNKFRIIPLQLPIGAIISQAVYFYKDDAPDTSLEMKLVSYDLTNSNKQVAGFLFDSSSIPGINGWTSAAATENVTIEANRFYAFQFYHPGSDFTTDTNIEYKGIRITYTLP